MNKKVKKISFGNISKDGPLKHVQNGNLIESRNLMTIREQNEFKKDFASKLHEITEDINRTVIELKDLILKYEPISLLQIAHTHLIYAGIEPDEKEYISSLQTLEYIINILASSQPSGSTISPDSKEEYQIIVYHVDKIYTNLISYFISRSLNLEKSHGYNSEFDEIITKCMMEWCYLRKVRHSFFDLQYLTYFIEPHNQAIIDTYAITSKAYLQSIKTILHALSFGTADAQSELFRAHDVFRNSLSKFSFIEGENTKDFFIRTAKELGLDKTFEDSFNKIFGNSLFLVENYSNLPKLVLDDLSWDLGGYSGFFTEPYAGWPLKLSPNRIKPFLKVSGDYYCHNLVSLTDTIYRLTCKNLRKHNPDYSEELNSIQKNISETLPLTLLQKILPNAVFFHSVKYPCGFKNKSNCDHWPEVDGLLIFDDHLFVIEVKAGAFTSTSPHDDAESYLDSIKSLITAPFKQAKRFIEYLDKNRTIEIFSCNNQLPTVIETINRSDFRHITLMGVTLDNFTTLAARAEKLNPFGVEFGDISFWSLAIDDLMVFEQIFDNPYQFLHYVEQRYKSIISKTVEIDDEYDHLGLYLTHNDYYKYPENMGINTKKSKLRFVGYSNQLDNYFNKLFTEEDNPKKPAQVVPLYHGKILDFLKDNKRENAALFTSCLLDDSFVERDLLNTLIGEVIKYLNQNNQSKPLSKSRFTLYLTNNHFKYSMEDQIKHSAKSMIIKGAEDWLIVNIFISDDDIKDISIRKINISDFSDAQLLVLRKGAIELKKHRVAKVRKEHKIGRNEECPCGSGKKYKHCCLNLFKLS